nr:Chain C, VAL-THR-THR-ASP-ILE-GLN-VAL-LYS-VAL [Homo sapiens]5U98_F Chain F, VAL-THR-THR-ASP-ILE-GLN-VAL-LYS-VAL [Homo sapiens]
VTTDIQVKV